MYKAKKKHLGNGLFSHTVSHAVPSLLTRFTSVFGMGTGGSTSPSHQSTFEKYSNNYIREEEP